MDASIWVEVEKNMNMVHWAVRRMTTPTCILDREDLVSECILILASELERARNTGSECLPIGILRRLIRTVHGKTATFKKSYKTISIEKKVLKLEIALFG